MPLNLIDDIGIFATRPEATKEKPLELEDDLGILEKPLDDNTRIRNVLWGEAANDSEGWEAKLNTYNRARKEGESLADATERVSSAFQKESPQYTKAKKNEFNATEKPIAERMTQTIQSFAPDPEWDYPHHENYKLDRYKDMTEEQIDDVLRKKWGDNVDFKNKIKKGKEYYMPLKKDATRPASTANSDILGQLEDDLKPKKSLLVKLADKAGFTLQLEDDMDIFDLPSQEEISTQDKAKKSEREERRKMFQELMADDFREIREGESIIKPGTYKYLSMLKRLGRVVPGPRRPDETDESYAQRLTDAGMFWALRTGRIQKPGQPHGDIVDVFKQIGRDIPKDQTKAISDIATSIADKYPTVKNAMSLIQGIGHKLAKGEPHANLVAAFRTKLPEDRISQFQRDYEGLQDKIKGVTQPITAQDAIAKVGG